jgi:hypothetical protein
LFFNKHDEEWDADKNICPKTMKEVRPEALTDLEGGEQIIFSGFSSYQLVKNCLRFDNNLLWNTDYMAPVTSVTFNQLTPQLADREFLF